MKIVMKGNKQLRVEDDRVDAMLAVGFSEVDAETGEVIHGPKGNELEEVKTENDALKKENKALKAENKKLKAEMEDLKKEGK